MFIGKGTHDEEFFYYDNLALKNTNGNINHRQKVDIFMNLSKKCVVKQVKIECLSETLSIPHTNKRKAIYTTMVKSQLNYCPLVWKERFV